MNNYHDLISVIVPVYNVEKYLKKCVNSILVQTYPNIEIILVDDGSTDDSGAICDSIALVDKRIRVIHKENGGLSDARNSGISIASGKYITFVDSDDRISPDMISILHEVIISTKSDFSQCQYYFEYENGKIEENYNEQPALCVLEKDSLIESFAKSGPIGLTVVAWGKLYKRELFTTIKYPKGKFHEDIITMCDLILGPVSSVAVIKQPLYYYFQRSDSIIKTINEKRLIDMIWAQEYVSCSLKKEHKKDLHYSDKILLDNIMSVIGLLKNEDLSIHVSIFSYIQCCIRKISTIRIFHAEHNFRLCMHYMFLKISVKQYLRIRRGK